MSTAATARRQHAGERREQILDAALTVFARKGFEGTSVREIAREVGVTEGLIYHYFESKDQLLNACWTERSFHAQLEGILAALADRPVDQVLREIMRRFLRTMRENAALVRVLAVETLHRGDCARMHSARVEADRQVLVAFLETRQRAGEIREGASLWAVANLLLGSAHASFLLWGESDDASWDQMAERWVGEGVDTVVQGIASRSPVAGAEADAQLQLTFDASVPGDEGGNPGETHGK